MSGTRKCAGFQRVGSDSLADLRPPLLCLPPHAQRRTEFVRSSVIIHFVIIIGTHKHVQRCHSVLVVWLLDLL